jgi:AcrR family transcriptional regulator
VLRTLPKRPRALARRAATARPAPSRRRPDGLKAAILDAARRICFAEGVDGISARKIARQVGCSATAIYLHYEHVDDVLHHLRMEGHALLAEHFRGVDAGLAPVERLREMGRAYYRFGVEHPNHYELMFLHRLKGGMRREFVQQEIFTLLLVRDAVKSGQDAGAVRADLDPLVLAHGLWSTMHGLTSLAVSGLLIRTAPDHEPALLEGALESIARWVRP